MIGHDRPSARERGTPCPRQLKGRNDLAGFVSSGKAVILRPRPLLINQPAGLTRGAWIARSSPGDPLPDPQVTSARTIDADALSAQPVQAERPLLFSGETVTLNSYAIFCLR